MFRSFTPEPLYVYDNIKGVYKVIKLCDKVDNNITDLEEYNLTITLDRSSSIWAFNTKKKSEAKKYMKK